MKKSELNERILTALGESVEKLHTIIDEHAGLPWEAEFYELGVGEEPKPKNLAIEMDILQGKLREELVLMSNMIGLKGKTEFFKKPRVRKPLKELTRKQVSKLDAGVDAGRKAKKTVTLAQFDDKMEQAKERGTTALRTLTNRLKEMSAHTIPTDLLSQWPEEVKRMLGPNHPVNAPNLNEKEKEMIARIDGFRAKLDEMVARLEKQGAVSVEETIQNKE